MVPPKVYTAVVREPRRDIVRSDSVVAQRAWSTAQTFVARNCVVGMNEQSAEQFIHALLWHCARHERGSQLRDELKGLCLSERTQQVLGKAYSAALATGRNATAVAATAAATTVPATPSLFRSSWEAEPVWVNVGRRRHHHRRRRRRRLRLVVSLSRCLVVVSSRRLVVSSSRRLVVVVDVVVTQSVWLGEWSLPEGTYSPLFTPR